MFRSGSARRGGLGKVWSGASGYGKSCFIGAAQGGLGGVRHRLFWLGGLGKAGQRGSSSDWVGIGMATQTSKIVRKLCGGKTNGLFLEEDEAADH